MSLSRRRDASDHRPLGAGDGRIRAENATHAPVDFDTNVATSITAHAAGYINQPLERSSACKRTSR
ncbi:hypothetical protein LNQ03_32165 [Klebsiella pneumoniae subsp. pneumoniae]|nr:hypothetical protein [Klebsiella pneumoniae subsp. pneumoniae]